MYKIVFACFVLLLLFAAPVMAQDSTPEATPDAPPVVVIEQPPVDLFTETPTVDTAGTALLTTIAGLVSWAGGLAVVTYGVSLLKRISLFDAIPANTLNFALSVIVTLLVWFGRQYGFEEGLLKGLGFLGGLMPLISQLLTTSVGASVAYAVGKSVKAPIVSYSRPG